MLVLVPSVTHIWERVIPGGGVHCHWRNPYWSQCRRGWQLTPHCPALVVHCSSVEVGCRNEIDVVGRETNERGSIKTHIAIANRNLSCYCASRSQYMWLVTLFTSFFCYFPSHTPYTQSHIICKQLYKCTVAQKTTTNSGVSYATKEYMIREPVHKREADGACSDQHC